MDEKQKILNEEIEESIQICEELMESGFLDLDTAQEDIFQLPPKPEWEEIKDDVPIMAEKSSTEKIISDKEPLPKPEQVQKKEEKLPEMHFEAVQKTQVETPVESEHEETSGGILKVLLNILICVVIALVAALLITKFVANHTTVEGSSMEPTLHSEDDLVVEKLSYLLGEPERFDVVVFRYDENNNYIKRIIGLPGESVRIEEGKIYINDRPIYDEHGSGELTDAGIAEKTIQLDAGEYFVLGDNREASKDSRNEEVGLVGEEQILGKAWLRVMPFKQFGYIE